MERTTTWTGGAVAALVFGVLAILVGLLLVSAYVGGAVIARIGEPDQSLLFWYLPFLLIGVFGIVLGVAGCVLAVQLRKRSRLSSQGGQQ